MENIYYTILYGDIYDDRLLVKPVKSAITLIPNTTYESPYEGAKEMLLIDDVDNKNFLTRLFNNMYRELPNPKKKQQNAACRENNPYNTLGKSKFSILGGT